MKEMIVEATFKGQNGSLGYRTGTAYKLMVSHQKKGCITIQDTMQAMGLCEYESMLAFLNNWTDVKQITAQDLKKDGAREKVRNFTDLCAILLPPNLPEYTVVPNDVQHLIKRVLDFYNEPFDVEKVIDYFKNWSVDGKINLRRTILKNHHSNGKWSAKIIIDDNSVYTFISGKPAPKVENSNWLYLPETMSEFISDCLREEDFELLFTKKAIKKIYG